MTRGIDPELCRFLTDPASYGGGSDPVEVIETHGACVFMSGERAIKVRKNVHYPYLDFSTPQKRLDAARREVELEGRIAPALAATLVRITREADGHLAFDGAGETIETAVAKRRFDQALLLDQMAQRGTLDIDLMRPLGQAIRRLHAESEIVAGDEPVAAMHRILAGKLRALEDHPEIFDRKTVADIGKRARDALDRVAGILAARARAGFVRRCHGDLHLGNIVLLDGVPTPFDAIEFDERLARIDVLYDLAFLLMDLAHRNLAGHASRLFNVCFAHEMTAGITGLAALPLMMAMRAGVRAQVGVDRAQGLEDEADRRAAQDESRSYLALMEALLVEPRPRLVAVGGLSGSGKSTLAAGLGALLPGACGALVVRSDVERKALAGVDDEVRLDAASYTPEATVAVYRRMREKAAAALAAGVSVVADAVHAKADERAAIAGVAADAGVPFDGLWLDAPEDELISRVAARTGDASDADARVVRRQLEIDQGAIDWPRLDAGGTRAQALARAKVLLGIGAGP